MSDHADEVEALRHEQRRVLAALLLGRPAGRETAAPRPTRTVLAGVALAGLVLAGAAIASLIAPRGGIDWAGPALVADADTGALYYLDDDPARADGDPEAASVLRPVRNPTSARLLAGDVAPQQVPGSAVAGHAIGAPVGLTDVPATVPSPEQLVTGWTACTVDGGGVRLAVAPEPRGSRLAAGVGVVVDDGSRRWLLTSSPSYDGTPVAHRHPIPPRSPAVDHPAIAVAPEWVRLFPTAGPPPAVRFPPASGDPEVCAVLDRTDGGGPTIGLTVASDGAAPPTGEEGRVVDLPPGHGALVSAADGTAYLVAGEGRRHRVEPAAMERLGLAAVEPVELPAAWLARIEEGDALSVEEAGS